MSWNAILCRYNEIALKGGNRGRFERLLVRNLRRVLEGVDDLQVHRERGRIHLYLTGQRAFSAEELDLARRQLPKVFGLTSFSPCCVVASRLETIEETAQAIFPGAYEEAAADHPGDGAISFRVHARRSDKRFPLESTELARRLADLVMAPYPRLQVDLKHAAFTLAVEVRQDRSYIFTQDYPGPGGMPSGSASGGVGLLSGGIDSPVACWLTMKRGSHLDFLTFHSFPYTPPETIAKVARLVKVLNGYQKPGRLIACNLVEAQKLIRDRCTPSYRTVLYRRLMMRIANEVARRSDREFLVTGESIGQVASQTIPNLTAINAAAGCLIVRPLICWDKVEIVELSRRIGTFEISKEPCIDSCTVFAPPSPTTGAKPDRLAADEARLAEDDLVALALSTTHVIDLETLAESPFCP